MNLRKKSIALLILITLLTINTLFVVESYAEDSSVNSQEDISLNTTVNVIFEKDTLEKEKWYKFVVPESGYYEIELSNPSKEYETELKVSLPDMNKVISWDKTVSPTSVVTYVECNKDENCLIGVNVNCDVEENYVVDLSIRKHTHEYSEPVIKKSHYSENGKKKWDGYKRYTCKKCLHSYDEVIPMVKSITLTKTKYVYDGKAHFPKAIVKDRTGKAIDPSIFTYEYDAASGNKKVRRHCVAIFTENNDLYDIYAAPSFTIVPKGTSISKLYRGRKYITVKWKKQKTQTTGYQIRYSLKKDMKKAKIKTIKSNKTTIKTIKKLKARKYYYVQIRTYKDVPNGPKKDRFHSSWSKVKKIKTK